MYNTLDYIESDVRSIEKNTELIKKGTEEIGKSIGWLENDLNELYEISEKLDFIKLELGIIIFLLIFMFVFKNKEQLKNIIKNSKKIKSKK